MTFPLLGTLSSIFGFAQGANDIGAVQAAGQAQESQAVSALLGNLKQNAEIGRTMIDTSQQVTIQNALTGKYGLQQNSAASTYETQLKVAGKWISVLSGAQ